jgi:hypothetical protein
MKGYMSAWEYFVRIGEGITSAPVCLYRTQEFKPGVNKYPAPGHHGDRNFYMIAPNICGSAVYSLLYINPPSAWNFVVARKFCKIVQL